MAVEGIGVGEDAAGHDPDRLRDVRAVRGVGALGDRAVGDVGVGADEVVRLDVAEQQAAIRLEAGPDADLRRAPPDGLEGLLERQDQAHGPARSEGHEGDQRLVLGVLLATEAATRVGREDADLGQRQVEQPGDDPLQPVRVLDRAPDRDAIAVRGGHEAVRLDGELGDHGEGVRSFDDDVRLDRIDVAPAVVVQPEDVRGRQRVTGSERRILDERRGWIEGRGDREDGRQLLVLDPDEPSRLLGRVLRLRRDGGDRLTVVLRLAGGQDRPIDELRSEPGHRLRQVGGGHHESDARDGQGGARVDGDDPSPGTVEADELDVEDVFEVDVGDVGLAAGDPIEAADAGGRVADALVAHGFVALGPEAPRPSPAAADPAGPTSAASSTASMICS